VSCKGRAGSQPKADAPQAQTPALGTKYLYISDNLSIDMIKPDHLSLSSFLNIVHVKSLALALHSGARAKLDLWNGGVLDGQNI
jgi:hypothetical protein